MIWCWIFGHRFYNAGPLGAEEWFRTEYCTRCGFGHPAKK